MVMRMSHGMHAQSSCRMADREASVLAVKVVKDTEPVCE